jgi:hypothetical protein
MILQYNGSLYLGDVLTFITFINSSTLTPQIKVARTWGVSLCFECPITVAVLVCFWLPPFHHVGMCCCWIASQSGIREK